MVFSCTPIELLSFLLEKLAFSGNNGLALNELWIYCNEKLGSTIDEFEKQIIWKWLFFSDKYSTSLFIWNNNEKIMPIENYNQFLSSQTNDENTIRVFATSETQWDYLVGKDLPETMRSQLGKLPYELLCAIAQSGPKGILAVNLNKLTGQDPRSYTPRLKKLEELNLITRKSTFSKSLGNTSLCTHIKFANESSEISSLDLEDFKITRDAKKLRPLIIKKVKEAPNQLRSLLDLRLEFGLGDNKSITRFFRGIVSALCLQGYLKKVQAKQQNGQLSYCVQFIKELSSNENDEIKSNDFLELFGLGEDEDEQQEAASGGNEQGLIESKYLPSYSSIFPITNQIYQQINAQPDGSSSMDVSNAITGVSDHRLYVRLLDSITSAVLENTKEKSLKKSEIYDGIKIKRSLDYEGKFKFYRYFGQGNCLITESYNVNKKTVPKLSKLNKDKFVSIGKLMTGYLLIVKKRKAEDGIDLKKSNVASKRVKSSRKAKISSKPSIQKAGSNESNDINNASAIIPTGSANNNDDLILINNEETGDEEYILESKSQAAPQARESKQEKLPGNITKPPIGFQPPLNFQRNDELSTTVTTKITSKNKSKPISLKALNRRNILMEIIRSEGGVVFTSASLRRELDRRIDSKYQTDNKTLSRDIATMVQDKLLECEDIRTIKTGQPITRKLLISLDPRPSEDKIEQIRTKAEVDSGLDSRIIVAYNNVPHADKDVTIFVPRPKKKRLAALSTSDKPERRITNRKIIIKKENGDNLELGNRSKGTRKSIKEINKENSMTEPIKESFDSIVNSTLRMKQRKKTNRGIKSEGTSVRKSRTLKLSEEDSSMMYKIFIISRTFKRTIDYEVLSKYFDGLSARDLQQKWTSLRKVHGGGDGVNKGIRSFEKIVLRAIDQGKIKSEHLNPIDYKFFLELWDTMHVSSFNSVSKRLYFNPTDNYNDYIITETTEMAQPLSDQLIYNSMVQKDEILSSQPFFYANNKILQFNADDDSIKTSLNALANEQNFSKDLLERIFGLDNANKVKEIVELMIKDREVILIDQNFKFTEKFNNSLCTNKLINQFHQSSNFLNNLISIFEKPTGIIISQGINDSHMISLLNTISNWEVTPIHIDKTYKFTSYESRLIDKSNLECDIIINGKITSYKFNHTPVPTGKIASHVWYKSDASIDTELWARIVVSVTWHILFHPGIQTFDLYYKFKPVLTHKDLYAVLNWLDQSGYIVKGKYDDYWVVNNQWYSIIG